MGKSQFLLHPVWRYWFWRSCHLTVVAVWAWIIVLNIYLEPSALTLPSPPHPPPSALS